MSTLRSKLKYLLAALFIGVWLTSAFHLAKEHYAPDQRKVSIEKKKVQAPSSSGKLENYSVLMTSVIGVIHYIYKK